MNSKISIKFCPNCGSTDVIGVIGGTLGLWECVECKFRGAIFPEREVDEKELKKIGRGLR